MGKIEKRLVLLSIVLISLLCIGAVSAADDAASDIVSDAGDVSIASTADEMETIDSIDEEIDDVTLIDDVADESQSSIEEEIVDDSSNNALGEESTKTFTNLKDEIGDKSEVTLSGTYKYDATADADLGVEGIYINAPVTINGPATLDGSGLSRILELRGKITLNGLTFINGMADYGGAIGAYGSDSITIKNCTFKDNTASGDYSMGGAIYTSGSAITITNCTFEGNLALNDAKTDGYGGAICQSGDGTTITYSNFKNNRAFSGGAIDTVWGNNTLIDYCYFDSNKAIDDLDNPSSSGEGGAINFEFDGYYEEDWTCHTLTNSILINNQAGWAGASFKNQAFDTTIKNCIILGPDTIQGKPIYSDLRSANIVCNWFGHTVDNASVTLSDDYDFSMPDNWYVLNLTAVEAGDYYDIIASLNNLYDKATGEISVDSECALPETLFNVNCDNGLFSKSTVNVQNGLGTVKYTLFAPDEGTVSVEYNGVTKSIALQGLAGSKKDLKLVLSAEDIKKGEKVKVEGQLTDLDNAGIEGIDLVVIVNKVEHNVTTDENGKFSFEVEGLEVGQYDAFSVFSGNYAYNYAFDSAVFNVEDEGNGGTENPDPTNSSGQTSPSNQSGSTTTTTTTTNKVTKKVGTVLKITPAKTVTFNKAIDKKADYYLVATLKDAKGNLLKGKKVSFAIDGKVYNVVTNAKGQAKVVVTYAKKGTYSQAVTFLGDDKYTGSFAALKLKVVAQKVKLTAPKKTFKATKKVKKLTATLKNLKGKAIKGKKITFIVNGKKYTAKTNKKGVATVKVKLTAKKTYKVKVKFAGDKTYKKASKKSSVKIK